MRPHPLDAEEFRDRSTAAACERGTAQVQARHDVEVGARVISRMPTPPLRGDYAAAVRSASPR